MSPYDPPPLPDDELNPYAAPDAPIAGGFVELTDVDSDAEQIRREHINHEASVRSIGSLHILGAVFGVFAIIGMVTIAIVGNQGPTERLVFLGGAGFYLLTTALNIALGIGLRKLHVWARWTETALLALGLVGMLASVALQMATGSGAQIGGGLCAFAVIGLIYGYILYLLLSAKGSMVFSERYKTIIARTPHIKYRTSLLVKLVVGLFLLIIILSILGGVAAFLLKR